MEGSASQKYADWKYWSSEAVTMFRRESISRRTFLQSASLAAAAATSCGWPLTLFGAGAAMGSPLEQFGYGDVTLASELHEKQLRENHSLLMALSEDSLLKPFRQMAGMPAPG